MKNKGFTLAELLIALAILGVIATFTIPKVLNTAGNSQNTAIAKEVAGMISGAAQAYTQSNSIVSGTTPGAFTQFMNYVKLETTTGVTPGASTIPACSAANIACLSLHNGGVMQYATNQSFGGTSNTAAIYFNVDPDGTGIADPITFVLSYNGRLTTGQNSVVNVDHLTTAGAAVKVATDPSYLQSWN